MLTSETIATFLAAQKAILLLTLAVNIWSLVALYRNARNRPSDYGLALMVVGLFGWTASILTLLLFSVLPAAHLAFFSTTVALTGFAWFALVYPSETYKKQDFLLLIPGVIVAICALIPNFFINGLAVDAYGYLTLVRNSTLIGFSVYTLVAGIVPVIILFRKKKVEQNVQLRQRLHWIAVATLITFGGSFVTNVFLPNFMDFPYLNSVGPSFSMMLATIIVWITSTEHYVDSRNVFGIITGRLALAAGTIIIFSSISLLLSLGNTESLVVHIVSATATAIAVFVFGPLIRTFGESILQQKDRRNNEMSGHTRRLFDALAHTTSITEIIILLRNIFSEDLSTTSTEIILAEKAEPEVAAQVAALAEIRTCTLNPPSTYLVDALSVTMPDPLDPHRIAVFDLAQTLGAQVIVPITHHQQIIGILALGKKKNGAGYTRNDAQMLAATARVLSPLLIRASIIDHADEVAQSLEENIAFRTHSIARAQEEERDIAYRLAQKITKPIEELRETTEVGEQADKTQFEVIGSALDKITQAAQGLLAYTRAKSAPFTASRMIDLSAVVKDLIAHAQPIAADDEIELRYELADGVVVRGNSTSVHNAFASIVANAFRYMGDDGERKITISLSANADQAIFSVSDTGIGIPGDAIDRIGTPLFHAHPLHEVEQGLGLGLAIARWVILQHGGTMVVTSLNEKGTTVRIALPLARSA